MLRQSVHDHDHAETGYRQTLKSQYIEYIAILWSGRPYWPKDTVVPTILLHQYCISISFKIF